MTAHAIILQHVLAEDAGLLTPILHDYGYSVTMIETPIHSVTTTQALDADLLIALGGPIGVEDRDLHPYLHDELDALGTRMADNAPTLGICLGAQLMAHALGADVTSTGRAEIGYGPLTLTPEGHHSPLAALGDTPVLHWHGDQFAIPTGATRLAETPGYPNQAFAHGPNILALQFHLEVDPTTIERWIISNANELALHSIHPTTLRRDAASHGAALATAGTQVFTTWLDGLVTR